MKVILPTGEVYKFSCEQEAQEALHYFLYKGKKEFKKEFEPKRVKKDETSNV